MVTEEERLKILKMIAENKITAEEGVLLIKAIDTPTAPSLPGTPQVVPGHEPRFLRIHITDTRTGRPRVNIRLPISVINAGFKMGARFSPEVQGLDAEQLLGFIKAGVTGQVVDIQDEEDGEHVEIYLE
ncbi:MAG TPA: hypothetical protein DDW19_01475 [Anaerolineaceae bacterium]|jgi:hypothetical protein|nr:hypothetical protein [Anaerolineaceae bacterium]